MKGFPFEIKNNLLEPKHVDNMGASVWLFMWLNDKVTSITEEQIGVVLGGKPVKYEEIKKELGISKNTYTRWLDKLLEYPYIRADRTPYGIRFQVLKAFKHFKKRITINKESTSPQTGNLGPDFGESNKTVAVDSSNNTPAVAGVGSVGDNYFSLPEYIQKMSTDPKKPVQIISLYWTIQPPLVETKGQASAEIKRNLRAAKALEEWDLDKIQKRISWVKKFCESKGLSWTLETVGKYIARDLSQL